MLGPFVFVIDNFDNVTPFVAGAGIKKSYGEVLFTNVMRKSTRVVWFAAMVLLFMRAVEEDLLGLVFLYYFL